jgi:phosphocarrier protein
MTGGMPAIWRQRDWRDGIGAKVRARERGAVEATCCRELLITNRRGLHARASAKFVQTVESFNVQVEVSKDGQTVGGTSIMGLMMLAASPGTTIHVAACGNDAEAALEAIRVLVEAKFYEE